MDFLNNNVVSTIIGAIVGGIIAIIAGDIAYHRQRKDTEEKEVRENFKNKAELSINECFIVNGDNIREICIIPCPYKAKLNKNGFIDTEISKVYSNKEKLKPKSRILKNYA